MIALIHQVCREIWFYEYRLPVALVGRFILEPWWLHAYRNVPTVTVSKSSQSSLEQYGLRNVTVVSEGMDPARDQLQHSREDVPTLVFVGRLAWNKRPDDAIEAFRLVRQAVPTAQMWVIGAGPMEPKLRKSAPSGVEFLGRVSEDEKQQRLARAHLLLVTSVREGWGLVVTEAAQHGTISVGYDVPGLIDSIKASRGVLVPPSTKELSNAIVGVLNHELTDSLPQASPEGVVAWKDVAVQFLEIVFELQTRQ